MAYLMNLLAAAVGSSPPKAAGSGLNLLQVLLGVLTVILLILFVGFLLSGRRRGKGADADDGILRPSAPHTPDDGANPEKRVIYHAQPRIMAPLAVAAEAPAETSPEPDVVEVAAPAEPEQPPDEPAPPEAPAVQQPTTPLTAWARSPAVAPAPSDGRQPAPARATPATKAPPFIFPSTQRAEPAVSRVEAAPAPATPAAAAAPVPSVAPTAAPAVHAAPALQEPAVGEARAVPAASTAAAPPGEAAAGNQAELILLIEDDERIAKFYSMLFLAKGFRVESAHDGIEGVDMAQALRPALILLDVMMPRMNGLMVLQVLRANPDTAKTPVVVLSNYMEPPLIQRALQLGAIEYVVKSQARPEQLVNALPSWLRGEPAIH